MKKTNFSDVAFTDLIFHCIYSFYVLQEVFVTSKVLYSLITRTASPSFELSVRAHPLQAKQFSQKQVIKQGFCSFEDICRIHKYS